METLPPKLFEAAKQGSIISLHQLLKDDPLILDRAAINCFDENPLHVAAMLGNIDFVKEIIRIKPELLDEVNSQQSTALHMAAAKGHVEVVRALLSANRGACLALDRNKLTPLHLAAAKGRVEVVKLLLEADADAAYKGESLLHLCVKRNQLEALRVVVKGVGDEGFVNSRDAHGNTGLHLAVVDKQVETVKFLLSSSVEVNAVNKDGMTALDILIRSKPDMRDSEIESSLRHGGSQHVNSETVTNNNSTRTKCSKDNKKNNWESLLKQHDDRRENMKSALMVVAVLIATIAFQIGANPPGGVYQDDKTDASTGTPVQAGLSVFAHKYQHDYELFYIINTIAFITSLSIILLLVSGLPLQRRFFMWILMVLTWISITTIALCYLYAVAALTVAGKSFKLVANVTAFTVIVWVILMALLLIAHTIILLVKLVKKMRKLSRGRRNNNIVGGGGV